MLAHVWFNECNCTRFCLASVRTFLYLTIVAAYVSVSSQKQKARYVLELKSLVVSAESVAEDRLAEALNGIFSIVEGSGEALPMASVRKMDIPTQILGYLLALRAAVILKYRKSAAATSEEIAGALALDIDRAREALSRLKRGVLNKTENGYEIPLPRTISAIEELMEKRRKL